MTDNENRESNTSEHREGVFKAIQGFQQRRKYHRLRKDPMKLPFERRSSIVGGKTVCPERFSGVFTGSHAENNAGYACTGQGQLF